MDKWKELCIDLEQFDSSVFSMFKCEVGYLTREKIAASKAIKEILIDWVFNFAEIYQKTKSYSLGAASSIEDLTSQVMKGQEKIIHLQDDVISSKDQQLACLRSTVKVEI